MGKGGKGAIAFAAGLHARGRPGACESLGRSQAKGEMVFPYYLTTFRGGASDRLFPLSYSRGRECECEKPLRSQGGEKGFGL